MRRFLPSLTLGAALIAGLSGSALLAQDQAAPSATPAQAPAPSSAQPPAHIPNPRHQTKKMARALALTPDQQSKIEPILADRDQQMVSVRSDTTLLPQDKTAKAHAIQQDTDARIQALLTDTQKQQYEQIKQARKANRHPQAAGTANS